MNTAVLVIDMQKKVYQTEPKPYEADELIKRLNVVCQQARECGVPVIFTQHEIAGFLEAGSEGWQLLDELQTAGTDICLAKTKGDVFQETALEDILKTGNIDSLIIMGFASEICVDSTTRRAVALGYSVQLVADAHTTHDKPHLSAEKIREHHNLTLSMSPLITIPNHDRINFGQ